MLGRRASLRRRGRKRVDGRGWSRGGGGHLREACAAAPSRPGVETRSLETARRLVCMVAGSRRDRRARRPLLETPPA